MNTLRSRVEPRINFILSNKGKTGHYQELAWILEPLERGELILNVISDRIESVHYNDEFITITNNAVLSMSEVIDDVEQALEAAEDSLSALDDAISKVAVRFFAVFEAGDPAVLLDEVSTIPAIGKTNMENITANEATLIGAAEKEEEEEERESLKNRPRA